MKTNLLIESLTRTDVSSVSGSSESSPRDDRPCLSKLSAVQTLKCR